MAIKLTPTQALDEHLTKLTHALCIDDEPKIDKYYKVFKGFINTLFIQNKNIDRNDLKTKINIVRFEGSTPLYAAISNNDLNITEYLLTLGADPNQKGMKGWTALHDTASLSIDSPEMIELLMTYQGDIHAVDEEGKTALHLAASNGHKTVMQSLIAHGANVSQLDSFGLTALYYIRKYGLPEIEELFPQDAITAEILARKFLAHVNGIGGNTSIVKDKTTKLTGFYSYPVCQMVLPYLTDFNQLQKEGEVETEHFNEIVRALHFASYVRSPEEYLQQIQSGHLTFIPAGWENHVVWVGFKGDIAAVLNKGQGVTGDLKAIQAFPVDQTKLTIDGIKAILTDIKVMSPDQGQTFFYHKLPQILSPSTINAKKHCDDLRLHTPKLIKVGICAYGAVKAAIQFGLSVLVVLKHPNQLDRVERLRQVKTFCSRFSTFCRLKSIADYLMKHFGDVLGKDDKAIVQRLAMGDFSLVEKAWLKVNKRLGQEKHRSQPLYDRERRYENQIMDVMKRIKAAK